LNFSVENRLAAVWAAVVGFLGLDIKAGDDIDGVVGDGEVFDFAEAELDIGDACVVGADLLSEFFVGFHWETPCWVGMQQPVRCIRARSHGSIVSISMSLVRSDWMRSSSSAWVRIKASASAMMGVGEAGVW